MPLSPGTRLGPYEVLSPIGAGGMGEVYRARHTKLDRDVALKVLPEPVAADRETLARFEREAKAVAALSHPNILSIFDFGTHDGVAYAVMELLEGETLRGKLDAAPLTEKQAVDLALQAASGLSAAHTKGIVHRDLKPENLFVTREGHLKILDFGLVKRVDAVAPGAETSAPTASVPTTPGTVMGTLSYMSPEQLRGLPVDHRSDLFSFGVVLYEMVTHERPFRGHSSVAVADAILHDEPRDLDGVRVSRKLKALVRRLLEKDATRRYASAEEACAELRKVEISLAPTRRGQLSRAGWIALAAAMAVVAAGVGWYWHRSSRVRWALETAAPEIERLVDAEDFAKAAVLAGEARAVLPNDPTLEKLWIRATDEASVDTSPPGAGVSVRPYRNAPGVWASLGLTPLKRMRLPKDVNVWRVSKSGFATTELIAGSDLQATIRLHPEDSVPAGMVVVAGDETGLAHPFADAPSVKLDDYFIDRHEVTNEEYSKFVEAGGYQKREFWTEPFVKAGRTVSWEDALSSFRDATGRPGPATWEVGRYPKGQEKYPVSGVSWYEAAAYARFAGESLPTVYHWILAAQIDLPELIVPGANFRGAGAQPVGSPGTLSGSGTTDMAGNVKEWCWNEGRAGDRFILGGGFGEPEYMFTQMDWQSPWDRKPNYGFRCVKLLAPAPEAATARMEPVHRDYLTEKPVSDEVLKAYRGLYAYDRGELDAKREETETRPDWIREKVSFRAAYGGERMAVHLFLPKRAVPPYQAVVFFPGKGARYSEKFDPSRIEDFKDFLPKSGRALVYPIYKGTFERRDGLTVVNKPPGSWRDHVIMWSKDLGRTLDYLETREDIDSTKLAYDGFSWGAALAPVLLAIDERFKAAILVSGGFFLYHPLPEADPFNFVAHARTPVLLLSDRYDSLFPTETSQAPFFHLLGTPPRDKRRVVYDSGHGSLPHREEIRESLDWLDKYLGPVKRQGAP